MELWIGIDESGDLGFSDKSSKYLVLAFVFTMNIHGVRKEMKRLLKKLIRRKIWPRILNELKFTLSKTRLRRQGIDPSRYIERLDDVRLNVLDKIKSLKIYAAVSIVEKNLVQPHLRNNPNKLYSYVLVHPLITRFLPKYNPIPGSTINIVLDKRLGSRAMKDFKSYVERKYDYMKEYEKRINYDVHFNVEQVSSHNEPLIWVADYIAGSINHYMVTGDPKYLGRVKEKIFDCIYFWNNPVVCNRIMEDG